MQPTGKSPDLFSLKQVWSNFVTKQEFLPEAELDPLVAISWQRCSLRMHPTKNRRWVYEDHKSLRATLKRYVTLLRIARPIMEDIYQYVEGCPLALVLVDSTGCLLEMLGGEQILADLKTLGVRPGVFLDEGRAGTNAVAIAITEGVPAQVVGPEHFFVKLHEICSLAAPIHKIEGQPVGVVGIIEPVERYSRQGLGVVVAAARAIENQLQAELIVREANIQAAELYAIIDSVSEGVLAWNKRGIILHLNEQGGQILDLVPVMVVGRRLDEYITLPERLARVVARQEEVSDVSLAFQIDAEQRECLVSLRVIVGADTMSPVFIVTLRRSEQVHQLVSRLVGAQARLTLTDIVGKGHAARRVRKQALTAARAEACVLITGETGTGKNSLARAIHNSSKRVNGPFLALNCRGIPRKLALVELLGHESNSLYGTGQPSKFELAHGGTLFLEEVDALPLDAQAALTRVIAFRDVIRLGGTRVIPVDARIIATAQRSFEELNNKDLMRLDLLHQLSAFLIQMVPLRERPDDIPLLIARVLKRWNVKNRGHLEITPAAQQALGSYPWPGNIRELETMLERVAQQCTNQTLELQDFPPMLRERRVMTAGLTGTEQVHSLADAERICILNALRATHGQLNEAAQLLKIGRTTLWRKMKTYTLAVDDFK